MAILGVESVEFGVEDLELCTHFGSDFGLTLRSLDERESVIELQSGSRIAVRHGDDDRSPERNFPGNGIRRTIWGVDSQGNLDRLATRLAERVEICREANGTVLFQLAALTPDDEHAL